jgi:hypothetical protein
MSAYGADGAVTASLDAEGVRDRIDIRRGVRDVPTRLAVRSSESGTVMADQPDAELRQEVGQAELKRLREKEAAARIAVHREHGPTRRIAVLGEAKRSPVARPRPLCRSVGWRPRHVSSLATVQSA